MPIFVRRKKLFLGFILLNKFSWPNGWLSPIACHTYFESLCISGKFRLSGNHFSASYEASELCWQIAVNPPQHLRPCSIQACTLYVCMWACVLLYMCIYEHVRYLCIWGCTLHVYLWACALHVCIQACTLTGASREPAPSVWHGAVQCSRIVWTWTAPIVWHSAVQLTVWTAPIVWHGTVQLSVWTAPIGAI